MSFKILILSLAVVIEVFTVNGAISPTSLFIKQRAEKALQQQKDSIYCQDHFSEVLKNLLATYDADIKQCQDTESEKLLELSTAQQPSRDATTESLSAVFASLEACKAESNNLDFFECINESGDENTRAIWKASRDSADAAAHIKEQIHVAKFQTDKCKSEAERVYVVGSNKASDDMISCIANGGIVPPPSSTA